MTTITWSIRKSMAGQPMLAWSKMETETEGVVVTRADLDHLYNMLPALIAEHDRVSGVTA